MKFKHTLLLVGIALTVPICSAWLRACLHDVPCFTGLTDPHMRLLVIVTDVLLLLAFTGLSLTVRTLWLVLHAVQAARGLPRQSWPIALQESVIRTGAMRIECIATDMAVAFCAGGLWPRTFVSRGLLTRLGADELDAVLLHENCHRRWRDPLWLAMMRAAADVCFYVPLVAWLANHARENAELRADRYALRKTGRRALAHALWTVGTESLSPGVAFSGAAELRAAQVLGDPLPDRHPTLSLWLGSGTGLLAAFSLAWCVSQAVLVIWY